MAKNKSLEQYKALCKELQGPELKPVYAFFGEESFFLDNLQEAALQALPEEARDFNVDILYGDDVSMEKLIGICRSYPMMAERRVVIVREFMKLFSKDHAAMEDESGGQAGSGSGGGPGQGGPENPEELIAYLNQPSPTTILILINEKKPSGITRLGKTLKNSKVMAAHTFEPVPDYQLAKWITDWAAQEHDLRFEENAAELLGFHVGNNLQQMTAEIEKLSNVREDGGAITVDDVKQVVGISREFTMFDFSDALMDRQTDKAMLIGLQMMGKADSPAGFVIMMVGYLYTTFGKIWHIQRLSRKGLTPAQIQNSVGIQSDYYYKKLVQSGRNFPLAVFPWLFEVLLDADKAIKGFSKETPEAILLMTIKKLTT